MVSGKDCFGKWHPLNQIIKRPPADKRKVNAWDNLQLPEDGECLWWQARCGWLTDQWSQCAIEVTSYKQPWWSDAACGDFCPSFSPVDRH
jgi:hypothetical protein